MGSVEGKLIQYAIDMDAISEKEDIVSIMIDSLPSTERLAKAIAKRYDDDKNKIM